MIKDLNNNELLLEIKNLVKEEKRITSLILDYLAEVESRRLYALRGYSSLFDFCVRELGYSESASYRRISAMRTIKMIPQAKAKLEEGSVNLSTLSQLKTFIQKEEKINGKLDLQEKQELLKNIENKSQRECEREFVKISPESVKTKETQRAITEDLTEIKFMASKNLMDKLEKLKSHLGHKDVQSMASLIETLADVALKKVLEKRVLEKKISEKKIPEEDVPEKKVLEKNATEKVTPENKGQKATEEKPTFAANVNTEDPAKTPVATSETRHIPKSLKQRVWDRDQGQCQYVDPLTQRQCTSRHFLQYDHVQPLAQGGQTTEDNLRILCHNQVQAINHFSREHMERFIPSLQ